MLFLMSAFGSADTGCPRNCMEGAGAAATIEGICAWDGIGGGAEAGTGTRAAAGAGAGAGPGSAGSGRGRGRMCFNLLFL